jgi:hypothetical protein
MRLLRNLALAGALAATAGCGGGGGKRVDVTGRDAGADGGPGVITLVGWVDDLVMAHTDETSAGDTVDDKVGVIMDTEDPAAFDPLLQAHAQ